MALIAVDGANTRRATNHNSMIRTSTSHEDSPIAIGERLRSVNNPSNPPPPSHTFWESMSDFQTASNPFCPKQPTFPDSRLAHRLAHPLSLQWPCLD